MLRYIWEELSGVQAILLLKSYTGHVWAWVLGLGLGFFNAEGPEEEEEEEEDGVTVGRFWEGPEEEEEEDGVTVTVDRGGPDWDGGIGWWGPNMVIVIWL